MAHLPEPPGRPDPAARRIITAINTYLASGRDPAAICGGLRHIHHHAEQAWDASIHQARQHGVKFREIQAVTGDGLGTLQHRIRIHLGEPRPPRQPPTGPGEGQP